jgi:hypothetical protein
MVAMQIPVLGPYLQNALFIIDNEYHNFAIII